MVKLVQFLFHEMFLFIILSKILCVFLFFKVSQKLIGRAQRRRRYKLQIFSFSVFGFVHQGSIVVVVICSTLVEVDRYYNIFLIIKLNFFVCVELLFISFVKIMARQEK